MGRGLEGDRERGDREGNEREVERGDGGCGRMERKSQIFSEL